MKHQQIVAVAVDLEIILYVYTVHLSQLYYKLTVSSLRAMIDVEIEAIEVIASVAVLVPLAIEALDHPDVKVM
jgi:hypothetical protein